MQNLTMALIAFGSNDNSVFGDQRETVLKSMKLVAALSQEPPRQSRLFKTPAFPAGAGPDFVNAAMRITTNAAPAAILARLHAIETQAKRTRDVRWGPRTLDLDLIAVGDAVLPDARVHERWRNLSLAQQQTDTPDQLILPHPRVQDRGFVLVPLCDVAPDWVHPVLQKTAAQLRDALPANGLADVVPLETPQ